MMFADIKRRFDKGGAQSLFLGDTKWLVAEVERLTIQKNAMHVVLAGVAAKADVPSEKLAELLDMAKREIEAVRS